MLSAALPACLAYHPASGDMVIVEATFIRWYVHCRMRFSKPVTGAMVHVSCGEQGQLRIVSKVLRGE